ncbi:Chemotaxis response regulator protein-glutamate methylesterase [bioreactor metagenome]|uniref:Chemotaxis response regulator protein-glutamate methylesterase n=1 Tax=bioreactor metagenome TaxID=1076179 RepID=A0A645E3H7_9ZZZZ
MENRSGHGLGLCIVKSCVELHGGSLEFTSMPNQRTTFRVHLPTQPPVPQEMRSSTAVAHALATVSPASGDKSSTPVMQTPDGLKILILDDDPLVRSMLVDMLQSRGSGNSLHEASTVTEASNLARDQQFDVAFVDVNLPDASGFELLKELPAKTAVIFMSNADEHAVQAFDCEAVDYLLKPISTERLHKALERACNRLPARPTARPAAQSRLEDSFVVKTMAEKRLVKIREIRNIAAYGEYSWVYWEEGKGAMLRKSLKQWQAELPADQFVRVHRRAIINLAFLDRIQNQEGHTQLYLKNSQEPIEVSSRLAPQLNRRLKSLGKLPPQA